MRAFDLYGLRIVTDLPLSAPPSTNVSREFDVEVRMDNPARGYPCIEGQVVVDYTLGEANGYTLTDTGAGYALLYPKRCLFWISYDLRSVTVQLLTHGTRDLAGLLLAGNVCAQIMTLAGYVVLHASAVEVEGVAIAFVGSSGTGKSTLAALMCAHGAVLITDDVLRLQPSDTGYRCYAGTREIRMRQTGIGVPEGLPAWPRGTSPDARVTLRPTSTSSMPRLHAIFVPTQSSTASQAHVELLSRRQALLAIIEHPRVLGIVQNTVRESQLRSFARLAEAIPVFRADIPTALPLEAQIVNTLTAAAGLSREGMVQI